MKEKIVRIFGWISVVFYSIMALITFLILIYESLEITALLALTIFIGMAITGWKARTFGLNNFKHKLLVKLTAIFSLIFGCVFAILSPFIFSKSYGIGDSYEPIIVLIIMFLPSIISSLAILIKDKTQII
ncbi:hypothetical protein [Flavobacterium flavipallidum]|uniref:Uncharacterized protein n=1 Tax=Flavobacterium flavipallidum TaxID=3139140 RepID=A0ABU9HMF8_9FLAO